MDFWRRTKVNTNALLGELGIIDGTVRLNQMGYHQNYSPVWVADHPRAFVDLLYISVLQSGKINTLTLDDWFPSIEDKERVYEVLSVLEKKLDNRQKGVLWQWKLKNPMAE